MSIKDDEIIVMLAEEAIAKGYQVLSFDLPEHGDRKEEDYACMVQNCVSEYKLSYNTDKGVFLLISDKGVFLYGRHGRAV